MPDVWIVVVLTVIIWYLSQQAGRLDRLHHRIDMSRATLDTNLAKRCGVVLEVANSELLDSVTSAVLAQSAHDALEDGELTSASRQESESNLSALLRDAIDSIVPVEPLEQDIDEMQLLVELENICDRVVLSDRFMGEAVDDCLAIRTQHLVRFLHLAGLAPLPSKIDLDVEPPNFLPIR